MERFPLYQALKDASRSADLVDKVFISVCSCELRNLSERILDHRKSGFCALRGWATKKFED